MSSVCGTEEEKENRCASPIYNMDERSPNLCGTVQNISDRLRTIRYSFTTWQSSKSNENTTTDLNPPDRLSVI